MPPQSFYKSFNELQQKAKGSSAMANAAGSRKGKGKGKSKTKELPKFDLKRAFPDRERITWQRLINVLETGETPKIKGRTVCLCQSDGQILEFQEMAKAWGEQFLQVGGSSFSILLIAAARQDDQQLEQGKETLIPFLGNIAMESHPCSFDLDGREVQFDQVDPKRITMKTVPKTDMGTLRMHIALDYVEKKHRDNILQHQAFALSLVGIEEHIKEAKTYQWTSACHMISGYMQIPREALNATLRCSEKGGIFFFRSLLEMAISPTLMLSGILGKMANHMLNITQL